MSELYALQEQMSAYLLAPAATTPTASLLSFLHRRGNASSPGLEIYKNNVFVRLIEALEASYPVVHRLVGSEFFRFSAQHFIAEHPPRSGALLNFVEGFEKFLRGFDPASSVSYLPDVARLEYLYLRAYNAPDVPSFHGLPRLSSHELSGLRLELHPSAGLMRSSYQVSRIWELNRRPGEIEDLVLPAKNEYLLVIRPEAQVEVRRLSPGAYAMVMALHANETIDGAFEAGSEAEPGFKRKRHLAALLRGETFINVFEERPKRGS